MSRPDRRLHNKTVAEIQAMRDRGEICFQCGKPFVEAHLQPVYCPSCYLEAAQTYGMKRSWHEEQDRDV